jgi:hypothetical protein
MDPGPPPGPGWTLGEDGHWKPPAFEVGGPVRPVAPQEAPPWPPTAAGAPPPWPPQQPRNSSKSALTVLAAIGGAFVLVAVICVAAVTMLGTSTSPTDRDAVSRSRVEFITTTSNPDTTTTIEPEPEPKITEALLASQRVSEYVGSDEWRLAGGQELPNTSTELCSPPGWNTGADSRFQTVYDHLTFGTRDGEATINLTVYDSAEHAAADQERAGSPEWYDCQRRRIDDLSGDVNPTIQAIPDDPLASGESYIESYHEGGQPVMETFHYVFVDQVRATITYCGCTKVGLEGRQAVARDVAAALAEVQGVPAPGPGT